MNAAIRHMFVFMFIYPAYKLIHLFQRILSDFESRRHFKNLNLHIRKEIKRAREIEEEGMNWPLNAQPNDDAQRNANECGVN